MKNFIILFFMLSVSFVNGQITMIDTPEVIKIGEVSGIKITKQNNTYTITYENIKYQQITDLKRFSFVDTDNAFDNLYQMIINGFNENPKSDIMLELPNDIVWLHFVKYLGVVTFQFYQSVNKTEVIAFSRYLTKKQVQKLFGKI